MKNFFTISLLWLGLLGGAKAQTCGSTISAFPYLENFDGAAPTGWTSGGTNSSWALAVPTKTIINTAASGTKAWVTNFSSNYNANEQSQVESPCFNMTSLSQPIVEFKVWWNTEFSADGAVLQSSIDGGTTWQVVGAMGDPFNWYNDNSINGAPGGQPAATAVGWSGRGITSNGSNGWVTVKHALTGLGGQANVKLRIAFGSDAGNQDQGFAFDSFMLYDTPVNDAGITSITSPSLTFPPSTSQPISVTVKNYGTANLSSATIGWSVDNVLQPNFTYTPSPVLATNAVSAPVQIGSFSFPLGQHQIKVWTKLPNGATDGYIFNDTTSLVVNACTALNGTYTINKSAGQTATNFPSFTTVAQALNSCGVSGPVTFNVVAGSGPYNETVTINTYPGAGAANAVIFNGNGNTIAGSPVNVSEAVIKLNGAQYLRFNNLTLINQTTTASSSTVQLINNASNNIFNGCTFNNSASTLTVLYGVNMTLGSNNNKFQNNAINGGNFGVYCLGASAAPLTGNQFTGNILKDQYSFGFYSGNSINSLIEGNDVSRPNRFNVSTFYGVYFATGVMSTVVSKNRFHNPYDVAVPVAGTVYGVYNVSAATVGNENIIKNNAIYNINNTGGIFTAFHNGGGAGAHYYYNTVSLDPNSSFATLRGIHFTSAVANVRFINNNISMPASATTKHAIYVTTGTTLISNNNNFYIGTSGNVGYHTTDRATLADWKTANTNAYDQNSLSVDPIFVSNTYLQPVNNALDNNGQPVPTITDDIVNVTRSATTPDIGAYEFTPSANDAGILAILSPTSPATPGNQGVQVTIKNYGTAPLTSVTIKWSVNGVAQPNFSWTGSLAPFQTSAPVNVGSFNFPAGNYTLEVCTHLPNGVPDGLIVNDCFSTPVTACSPLAGNYTINKNNPTAGSNFSSIAEATERLNSCGVSAPVTFTVTSGTGPYTEQVILQNIPNASATNTVTFEGNGNTVLATPLQKPGMLVLDGAKYVKVNNFEFTLAPGATFGWGAQLMNAADYSTISNNTFNLPINNSTTSFNGIMAGTGVTAAGNNTSYSKIQNNTINGGYFGIQVNGNIGGINAVDNEITGNQVRDVFFYGIYLNHATNTLVEGNDISRATRTDGGTFVGIQLMNVTTKSKISKNRIHNAYDLCTNKTGSFTGVQCSAATTPGNENVVKNNIIYNINNSLGTFVGFSSATGTHFYNNSVASDPALTYFSLRGLNITGVQTNVKFINNIISFPSASNSKYTIFISSVTTVLETNNNNLYVGTSGHVGHFTGLDYVTLANWKTANSSNYDLASVSADPVFINAAAGNLKPNSVTIENLGQPLAAVTDDILGIARHATTPDFGAYEFGVPANDVGITAISTPAATGCGLTSAETITVTIRNHGANPQPAVPVIFLVNGTPMAATPETYNASPIPANGTATYTFTTKANLANSGKYQIIAKTQLATDLFTNNDADTLEINNPLILTLPFTLDFETPATGLSFLRKEIRSNSNIAEQTVASSPLVTTSTKGIIMDAVTSSIWVVPGGTIDPWTNNPNHFSALNMCLNPAGGAATDSLWLTFDIRQLFLTGNANTNFRVTIDGTQVGPTYRPPFDPNNPATPNNWRRIKVDLSAFKNLPSIKIGLESNVMKEYNNGTGTANLIDNVTILRRLVMPTGVKENALSAQLNVFPNPGNGMFHIALPTGKPTNWK